MNPIKIIPAIIAVIVIGISISYFSFESNVTDIQNNNNLEELGSLEESVNNKLIETTIIDEFGQESKLIIRLTDKIIKNGKVHHMHKNKLFTLLILLVTLMLFTGCGNSDELELNE